jgi:hypothetical protein
MPEFSLLPRVELDAMAEAAATVRNCRRILAKTGDTIVSEILRGAGIFYEWRHYPPGDVYDAEYHAQYYYHAHPEGERAGDEHGHFHTFLRPLGMPPDVGPAPLPGVQPPEGENEALSHLVGLSMDRDGQPVRLFTTNRWVTGETWYAAPDVVRMLDGFKIDHARPSWPVNTWITAMLRLFRPQIVDLLHARDRRLRQWQAEHPGIDAFEDRGLDVASEIEISVERQIGHIEMTRRRDRRPEALRSERKIWPATAMFPL